MPTERHKTKEELDMEKRIIDDIKRSGIPTEIRVSSILRRNGWDVANQLPYDDSGTIRPIDIIAFKAISPNMGLGLVIECKKSEKPWVFYMLQKEGQELQRFLSGASMFLNLIPVFMKLFEGKRVFEGKIDEYQAVD